MEATFSSRLSLAASTASLHEFREFVQKAIETSSMAPAAGRLVTLALDEALTSIIWAAQDAHAGSPTPATDTDHPRHFLELGLDVDDVRFKAVVAEGSRHFDLPLNIVSTADLEREAARVRQHEFSMRMLCTVFDEIDYAFKKGFQNELVLVKFL